MGEVDRVVTTKKYENTTLDAEARKASEKAQFAAREQLDNIKTMQIVDQKTEYRFNVDTNTKYVIVFTTCKIIGKDTSSVYEYIMNI